MRRAVFLFLAICLALGSCEKQRTLLARRQVKMNYFDSLRRAGFLRQDSVFRSQQAALKHRRDSLRKLGIEE